MKRGMTLIEILIAAAISMVLLLAVILIFRQAAGLIADKRNEVELAGQIRLAAEQVRGDLQGVTVPTIPPADPNSNTGYFEIVEGPAWDGMNLTDGNPANDLLGDLDDVLMFTAWSDRPFVGIVNNQTLESNHAEIVLWPDYDATTQEAVIRRRVLLIRPDVNVDRPIASPNDLAAFFAANDISARVESGRLVANNSGDLTKRESRFAHFGNFPFPLDTSFLTRPDLRRPDDILLRHVVAFDVRVYDPMAEVRVNDGRAVQPGDPGYNAGAQVGQGCYVDLGYSAYAAGSSTFSGAPLAKSQLMSRTYCTWSKHYEHLGIRGLDQNGDGLPDSAADGLDNDGINGIDDAGEQETLPPYPLALRGVQVTIRAQNIDDQKARQVTVQTDFLRE